MEAWRTRALEAGIRPAALAFRAEMKADRAGAIVGERMAKALRAAPEARAAIFGDLDDRRAGNNRSRQHRCICKGRNRQRKRGSQSKSSQHVEASRAKTVVGLGQVNEIIGRRLG